MLESPDPPFPSSTHEEGEGSAEYHKTLSTVPKILAKSLTTLGTSRPALREKVHLCK